MNKPKRLIVAAVLLAGGFNMFGFVMIGQLDNNASSTDVNGTTVEHNLTDDLGGPKGLKTFFRWNTPHLTYSFDQSFTRYFGIKGMEAVHDAFRVLNDFFIPEDKSYVGVSQMDFARDGFQSNYNTAWVNITAQNQQIIDLKSILLGMMVNQLGVGNPHRFAFTVHDIIPNSIGSEWNFNVRLKNFDPISWEPTDVINGVTYSYRLIHDAIPSAGLGVLVANAPSFTDMEEFTTDTSGNAWTAVSGIVDAFYGNTMIYWTEPPTLFNFGVYYDGMNAMGGQYQPRHALTYDDAGALKYLYRTNNFVREELEQDVTYIKPAQFLDPQAAQNFLNPNNSFMPAPGPGTAPTARTPHTFPRRAGVGGANTSFTFPTTSPWIGARGIGGPFVGLLNAGSIAGFPGIAIRGGIDKMQFHYVPFDSLMAVNFTPTNFFWADTVVHNNGRTVIGANNTTPGASQYMGWRDYRFATQIVGRTVLVPDIVISAAELGTAVDGVPIAWSRTDNTAWQSNHGYAENNSTGDPDQIGPGTIRLPTTPQGKGTIQFQFGKMSEGFEMIWSGEASVVGNQETYSLWGYIKGPGANDLVTFPDNSMIWRMENEIAPKVSVPLITMLSDNGGLSAIAINSYTRTQETISIIGSGLASGTAIEIMNGDLVLQTLFPVGKYLISDQRIDIPPGVLTEMTEGTARKIRVWNTVGSSEMSPQTFNIYTGRTVVTGTSKDESVFDRAQSLTVYGYGFKSTKGRAADGGVKLSHLRIEDGQGNVLLPTDGNSTGVTWEVLSDTQAVLPMNTLTSVTDGTYRRIRVARENGSLSTLSLTNNVSLFNYITTKPTITAMKTLDVNGTEYTISDTEALRRDRALELTGTAMNTAIALEIVQLDGSSFPNPVVINLPSAGVTVDDNGTRIQLSANVIPYNDADGHTADQFRKLKVYNAVGNYTTATIFNVNVQPVYAGTGGFTVPNSFNRHPTLGDDVTIIGTGFMAVSEIQLVDENGSNLNSITTSITLPSPGVIVTGTSILIDISTIQFNNGLNTDSIASNRYRRFRLVSKRDAVMSSQATRFDVGVPPTYASIGGTGLTGVNYQRDAGTITFTGAGLGLLTQLEIVDLNGNPISGVSPVTETTGVTITSGTQISLDANASALVGQGHLFDSATYLSNGNGTRRIKVTTPFGLTTSIIGDGFTVSAKPDFLPVGANNVSQTFAGSADFNGTDYNASVGTGLLVINGSNFRGITTIDLNGSGSITLDPVSPPAGVTFNAAGTQININKLAIDTAAAGFLTGTPSARTIILTSAGGATATTPSITVGE